MSRAEEYARWVLDPSNEHLTGRLIKLAAQRFVADLQRTDIYFDEKLANKIVNFAEKYCCLWEDKWRGEPVKILPWMAFIFQQIFGWYYKETGLRRFRRVYVQVAKKNGKTTIAGVLNNFHLFADDRVQTPKIFVGANNEDQAKICVNISGKLIEQSPALSQYVEDGDVNLFKYKENIVNIVHKTRDGFIKGLSKESSNSQSSAAGGKHGFNPSLGVIDEYAMADTDALLNALESGQAARQEPLIFCITTAGFKKNGPCYLQLRKSGMEILEGVSKDDSYLPVIFEMDKGDDIADENNWIKCNPNLGISVFPEFLRSRLNAARNEGGSKMIDVRTLNFNEWCETPQVWIPQDIWTKNVHGLKLEDLRGKPCFGGFDISSGLSFNAFSLFFPHIRDNCHAVVVLFWCPLDAIRSSQMRVDYQSWANGGYLEICEGNVIDNDWAYDKVYNFISQFDLDSVAFNVTLQTHDVIQGLVRAGIKCNPISQGYRMQSTPTKAFEEMLMAGEIDHLNNPMLAWQNLNTQIARSKDGDIRVQKMHGLNCGIPATIQAIAQWKTISAGVKDVDQVLEGW
jgi:phage terminase large subunit-like protein